MPIRWTPPVFPLVVLAFVFAVPMAVGGGGTPSHRIWATAVGSLSTIILLTVIAHWVRYGDGVLDLRTETGESVRLMDLGSRNLVGNAQKRIDQLERSVNQCLTAVPAAPRRA